MDEKLVLDDSVCTLEIQAFVDDGNFGSIGHPGLSERSWWLEEEPELEKPQGG